MPLSTIFHDALLGSWALAFGEVNDVLEPVAAVLIACPVGVILLVGHRLLVLHLLLQLQLLLLRNNWML